MGVGFVLILLALVCFLVGGVLALPRFAAGYALAFIALGLALQALATLLGAR
jgi:hypothetical protein